MPATFVPLLAGQSEARAARAASTVLEDVKELDGTTELDICTEVELVVGGAFELEVCNCIELDSFTELDIATELELEVTAAELEDFSALELEVFEELELAIDDTGLRL